MIMQPIVLKIKLRTWVGYFLIFYVFSTIANYFQAENLNISTLLTIAFFSALFVTGATFGIFYFYQKQVTLTDHEIKKIGLPSKSISYREIRRIRVGTGGYSIYDGGKSPINISRMYSNFDEATKLRNEKIMGYRNFEIIGLELFINKYI